MTLGSASYSFLTSPAKFETWEFLGIAFIIAAVAIHWSHFINDVA